MKQVLKKIFNIVGLDIVKLRAPRDRNLNIDEHLGYELEVEAAKCIGIIRNNTMLSKRRLVTLYQQVAYCEENNIPGSFVECGVWKGGAIGLMALANLRTAKQRRHLHLFDAADVLSAHLAVAICAKLPQFSPIATNCNCIPSVLLACLLRPLLANTFNRDPLPGGVELGP